MMGGGMGGRSKYGSPNPKVEEELKRPRRGILLRLGKYLWQMKWFLLLALGLTIGGNTFSCWGPRCRARPCWPRPTTGSPPNWWV